MVDLLRRYLFFTKEIDGNLMIIVDCTANRFRTFLVEISAIKANLIVPSS